MKQISNKSQIIIFNMQTLEIEYLKIEYCLLFDYCLLIIIHVCLSQKRKEPGGQKNEEHHILL